MSTLQEQKKLILPFLQRASEVARAEPKIAYYCRLYAVSQAVSLGVSNLVPDIKDLLNTLLASLEHDKKALELGPDDAILCETFALTVFGRADRADRVGQADKNTALTYYAASIFMEIINQFGELAPETLLKQRFAAWRAAEIRRALAEGRVPDPPPSAAQAPVTKEDEALLASLTSMPSVPQGGAEPEAKNELSSQLDDFPVPPRHDASVQRSGTSVGPSADSADLPGPGPAAGPEAGGQGRNQEHNGKDEEEGSLRLPSPPLSPPMGSGELGGQARPISGMVWTPPPPRAFYTFQKVLFCPEGASAPAKGTVARVSPATSAQVPAKYFVALAGSIEACGAEALVPDLATGENVLVHTPGGVTMDATVAAVDSSRWPPSYAVRLADGTYSTTSIERIEALGTGPPGMPGDGEEELEGLKGEGASDVGVPAPPGGEARPPPPPSPPKPKIGEGLGRSPVAPPSRPATSSLASAGPPARPPEPTTAPVPGFEPSLAAITEAQRLTKTATSALSFEDVRTAVRYLNDALRLLTQP
uniref:Vacuolar protein sorting-associated protein VTA1-like protein n=1 Tax=Auxenochlorella protothecoides TaxID=3075 RepID=A0A1D1ZQU4_AUXPR